MTVKAINEKVADGCALFITVSKRELNDRVSGGIREVAIAPWNFG